MGFFTLDHDLTLLGLLLVIAFIVFAFRQGQRVTPSADGKSGDSVTGVSGGGGGGDSHGGFGVHHG